MEKKCPEVRKMMVPRALWAFCSLRRTVREEQGWGEVGQGDGVASSRGEGRPLGAGPQC